ncbi:hypothetical protein [Bacillus cereus group sp. BfR-BA-01347]|uniref:hypothetical protein n=1 Tax=Bacillus cereus group sp. BfR-BA-01347 TaxID=2920310 RepID=UPI001F5AA7DD|nr:hypothetical protein [Bacillus cereus group sp. BfR-BA-01347]
MFKFVASFMVTVFVLVTYSDWIFANVPGAQEAWEWTKIKVTGIYQSYGMGGVAALLIVVLGVISLVRDEEEGR